MKDRCLQFRALKTNVLLDYVTACTRNTVKEGGLGQYDLGVNGGGEETWKM